MAGPPLLHAGLASHQSFQPNYSLTASASRVSSEPVSNHDDEKSSDHKRKSHRRHPSSRHDKEHRHSSSRRHARDVVQSAIQLAPPTSFGDLLKQARGSKDTSPSHSRKGSVVPSSTRNGEGEESGDTGMTIPPRKPLRPADVALERKRVQIRERDLRTALKSLSDQSLKTSRRLDDTYYSILEKLSVLRQTIGSLQELSSLTRELRKNFETDTKELVDDVQGQYDGFENFDSQQEQIVVLEDRIQANKNKADCLTDRLAKARERVDARAQSESEWTAKNTRRTRIFWSSIGFIASIIFALVIFYRFRPASATHNPAADLDFASRAHINEADLPEIAKEAMLGTPSCSSRPNPITTNIASVPTEDERLRVFDEL